MAQYMMGIRVPDIQQVSVPGGNTGYIPVWTPPTQETPTAPIPSDDDDNEKSGGGNTPKATVVSQYTRRAYGGKVETVRVYSDGTEEVIDSYVNKSAGEDAAEIFRMAGLDPEFVNSLMGLIDKVYNDNIDPSAGQVLNVIYNSDAYKQRFAGNEAIRKRMADGQGRPGDRLLSPKEYMDAESSYRTILQDAGMPEGYYDTPSDFNDLIANSISVSEFKSRVDTAFDALNRADEFTVNALQQYYGLSNADLAAYMLDPTKATPVLEGKQMSGAFGLNNNQELQKIYSSAQVGGAAGRQGLDLGSGMAEEIVDQGKTGQAEEAFATAGALDADVQRLGSLYGSSMDFKDLVKESLNLTGGVAAGKKRRKFASKERAAFGGQGAVDRKSLSRMQDV